MKPVFSAPPSPKISACTDKWNKSGQPIAHDSSSTKTRGKKLETSKMASKPNPPPEELLAKKMNKLLVVERPKCPRKTPTTKPGLGQNSPGSTRPPLPLKCSGLADIADLILNNCCMRIIVMAGAGISTPSGIPDFRTPGSGLYDNLNSYNIPYPEAIFDIDYFTYHPEPFFTLAKELYPGKYKPNLIHYFVRLLHEKGLLLRCYTQNIDGLERMAGIPPSKLVEAHGTFSSASCHLCYTPFPATEARDCIMRGKSPRCKVCYGVVKPDIVFFGEALSKRFAKFSNDFPKADLLIVMGTSLEIEPFASIVNSVRPNVPRLLINRDPVGPFQDKPLKNMDVMELGELCDGIRKFVDILDWQADIEELIQSKKHKQTRDKSVRDPKF